MKTYKSFGALARAFERVAAEMPATLAATARAGALTVQNDARERIGHYQAGWDVLAQSTLADKRRQGFFGPLPGGDGGDNPLLRTGDMRKSIVGWSGGPKFVVGSSDEVMVYQEIGTVNMPPRPVLAPALKHMAPFVSTVLGRAVEKTLAGEKYD